MKGFRTLLPLTAVSLACATASPGAASIPPLVDIPPAQHARTVIYALNTGMIVREWVLCISQESAEQLVHAREESDERARSTLVRLRDAKAFGQFPELRVILKKPLHRSPEETGHAGRVFGALAHVVGVRLPGLSRLAGYRSLGNAIGRAAAGLPQGDLGPPHPVIWLAIRMANAG